MMVLNTASIFIFFIDNKYILFILIFILALFIITKLLSKSRTPIIKVTQKQYDIIEKCQILINEYMELIGEIEKKCDNAQDKAIENNDKNTLDEIQMRMKKIETINNRLSVLLNVMMDMAKKNKLKNCHANYKDACVYIDEIKKIENQILENDWEE